MLDRTVTRETAETYAPAALHGVNAVVLLSVACLLLLATNNAGGYALLAAYVLLIPLGGMTLVSVAFTIAWARVAAAAVPTQRFTGAVGAGTAVGQTLLFALSVDTDTVGTIYEFTGLCVLLTVINTLALLSHRRNGG